MSVVGIGIDLVEIPRVHDMLERFGDRAMTRLLLPGEQEYCRARVRPAQHMAARLAAKEAAYKALQSDTDADHVSWLHIEVVVGENGRPSLTLHGPAHAAAQRLGVTRAMVSLTHSEDTAAAAVVLQAD